MSNYLPSLIMAVLGSVALVLSGRWVSRSQLPSIANDTIAVLRTRVEQQDTEIRRYKAALADMQIRNNALSETSGKCADCPLLKTFRPEGLS